MILSFDTPSNKTTVEGISPGSVFEYSDQHYMRMQGKGVGGLAKVVNIVTGASAEFLMSTVITPYIATVSLRKAL